MSEKCPECGNGEGWVLGFPKQSKCMTCNPQGLKKQRFKLKSGDSIDFLKGAAGARAAGFENLAETFELAFIGANQAAPSPGSSVQEAVKMAVEALELARDLMHQLGGRPLPQGWPSDIGGYFQRLDVAANHALHRLKAALGKGEM